MLLSRTTVLLALLPFSIAATCTSSNALPWSSYRPNSGGGGGGGENPLTSFCTDLCNGDASCLANCNADPCKDECGQDADCYAKCTKNAQAGQCNSVGGSACDGLDESKRKLRKRITLTCTSDETCYKFTDNSLLCLDQSTGDYHDDIGGTGSAITGAYTYPNGEMIVVSDGITSTVKAAETAARTDNAATTQTTEADTSTQTEDVKTDSTAAPLTSARSASRTGGTIGSATSAAVASATSGSAAVEEKLNAGAFVGAMALGAGFIL